MAKVSQHVLRKCPDGTVVVDKQDAQRCRGQRISDLGCVPDGRHGLCPRQPDRHCRPFAGGAFDRRGATHLLCKTIDLRQTETSALSDTLRGEEWFKGTGL